MFSGATTAGPGAALDFADQVERRSERGFAFLPLGRADFTGMRSDILGSLDLAQQFAGIAAHATGVDFDDLDLAFRIDDDGATVGAGAGA